MDKILEVLFSAAQSDPATIVSMLSLGLLFLIWQMVRSRERRDQDAAEHDASLVNLSKELMQQTTTLAMRLAEMFRAQNDILVQIKNGLEENTEHTRTTSALVAQQTEKIDGLYNLSQKIQAELEQTRKDVNGVTQAVLEIREGVTTLSKQFKGPESTGPALTITSPKEEPNATAQTPVEVS